LMGLTALALEKSLMRRARVALALKVDLPLVTTSPHRTVMRYPKLEMAVVSRAMLDLLAEEAATVDAELVPLVKHVKGRF
jgi:hypothetical protein